MLDQYALIRLFKFVKLIIVYCYYSPYGEIQIFILYRARQKSSHLKNFANILTTIESRYIKFYTLVT